jgi:hypothetical protein
VRDRAQLALGRDLSKTGQSNDTGSRPSRLVHGRGSGIRCRHHELEIRQHREIRQQRYEPKSMSAHQQYVAMGPWRSSHSNFAAAVAEHMRMDRERHLGASADPAEQSVKRLGRHRALPAPS